MGKHKLKKNLGIQKFTSSTLSDVQKFTELNCPLICFSNLSKNGGAFGFEQDIGNYGFGNVKITLTAVSNYVYQRT